MATFENVNVGQKFEYDGVEFRKLPPTHKNGYGHVNAVKINPAVNQSYPGDTGHRAFYDSQEVKVLADFCPFTLPGLNT